MTEYGTYYPPSRPRKVEGGLKAHSTRGEIGASWWSRRFIDVLESFSLGSRLTRGRNYARAGQVLTLDIKPGTVTAAVQGSRPRPYRVSVALAPFPELVWAKVEVTLAEQAIHSAKLLAGQLPPELENVFATAGAPLFPQALRDMTLHCSCPDWEVPCKHLAATFYLLAEAFDTDPFQILLWRGRAREPLLTRLRALRAADADHPDDDPAAVGDTGVASPSTAIGAAVALGDLTDPPTDPQRFWYPPVPLPARPPTLDTEPDLLLRQLPAPSPELGATALVEALTAAYQRLR
jgi:uncharacterized Zn finger protein